MENFMSGLTVGWAAPKLKMQGLCYFRRLRAMLLIEILYSCSLWQEYFNASITDKAQIKSDINQRLLFLFFSFLLIRKSSNNRINSAREKIRRKCTSKLLEMFLPQAVPTSLSSTLLFPLLASIAWINKRVKAGPRPVQFPGFTAQFLRKYQWLNP